jgi:hypothetical protein
MTLQVDEKRWYLAGPMSGIPQHNFPLFDRVAAKLRAEGLTIVSPAELDDDETRAEALASTDGVVKGVKTWGDFLSRDVKLVADKADGIILMDDWYKSRGARLEAFVGLLSGKKFALWQNFTGAAYAVSTVYVRQILTENMP